MERGIAEAGCETLDWPAGLLTNVRLIYLAIDLPVIRPLCDVSVGFGRRIETGLKDVTHSPMRCWDG